MGSVVAACAPEIGDDCASALDCSASGTRLCDLTQPGGYCTVEGCEEKTCPDEAVCVQFGRRIDGVSVDRLARRFCMYKCESKSDCRADEGYDCFSAESFGGTSEARVLGNAKPKFCASLPPELPAQRDAGPPQPEDAAMSMPEADAAIGSPSDDAGMSLPDAGPDAGTDAMTSSMPEDDGGV